jgi:hypothetical protein
MMPLSAAHGEGTSVLVCGHCEVPHEDEEDDAGEREEPTHGWAGG